MDGEVDTEELRELLEAESCRVVDIRSPGAYERGHIPGTENVPLQELVDDIERFEGDERVVTICPHGKSSVQAARLIASYEGFSGRAESYGPGLSKWDGPLESADADSGSGDEGPSDEGPAAPF